MAEGYGWCLFDPRLLKACPLLLPSQPSDCLFAASDGKMTLLAPSQSIGGHNCVALR